MPSLGDSVRVPPVARGYQGHRAGIVTRFAAAVIDFLVLVGLVAALYGVVIGTAFIIRPGRTKWPDWFGWSLPGVAFVLGVLYLALSWSATGRSRGAAVLGLRVVNRHGERPGLLLATVRAAFYIVFPIGLFLCIFTRQKRSLQDVVLRTSVIYDWNQLIPEKHAS